MVRRIWLNSLWAALASTGLALGQQPVPQPTTGANTGTIITVQEMNKPAQKCVIVKSWITAEGAKAHQVQALDTGELMTIIEAGPPMDGPPSMAGGRARAVTTRIFHWGRGSMPPSGTPMPPMMDSMQVVETPPPAGTIVETEVMPEKRGLHLWPASHAPSSSYHMSGHSTVVSTQEPPAQLQMAGQTSSPAWTNDIPTMGGPGTAIPGTKATPIIVSTQPKPESAKTPVEPAKPSDWRQSWGKPQTKTDSTSSAAATAKSGEWHLFSSKPKPKTPAVTAKADGKDQLPKADSKLTDPLKNPVTFGPPASKQDTAQADSDKKASDKKETPLTSAAKPADPAALPTPAQLAGQGLNAKAPADRLPLGAQSVLAANGDPNSQVKYLPVPIVTVPDPRRLGPLARPSVPQAPQPNQNLQRVASGDRPLPQNAFDEPGSEPPPPGLHASSGMTNAFTPGAPEPAAGGPGWLGNGLPGPMGMPPSAPQGMYAGRPNMPMAPGMMASRAPGTPGTLPPTGPYTGPSPSIVNSGYQPPQGNPSGLMPAGAQVPPGYLAMPPMNPAMMQQYAMARPPMPAPMQAAGMPLVSRPDAGQLLITLRDSMYPSQREWAADQLVTGEGRNSPQVRQAMLTAAREDPAATVRAGCVRCLVKIKADNPGTVATLMALKSDHDIRVRHEAEEALLVLAPGLAAPPVSAGAVTPASATVPARP